MIPTATATTSQTTSLLHLRVYGVRVSQLGNAMSPKHRSTGASGQESVKIAKASRTPTTARSGASSPDGSGSRWDTGSTSMGTSGPTPAWQSPASTALLDSGKVEVMVRVENPHREAVGQLANLPAVNGQRAHRVVEDVGADDNRAAGAGIRRRQDSVPPITVSSTRQGEPHGHALVANRTESRRAHTGSAARCGRTGR